MRIILEGPDNAGKTTLANAILDGMMMVDYHHAGGPPATDDDEFACMAEQLRWLCKSHVVVDRITAISQQVYNPSSKLSVLRMQALNELRQKCNPLIIYCRPSTDRLMRVEGFSWRDGETEEHKQKIIANQHQFIQRYDSIMATVPHLSYDFDDAVASKALIDGVRSAMNGSSLSQVWLRDISAMRSY